MTADKPPPRVGFDRLHNLLKFTAALVALPATVAGTMTLYRGYFSTDAACQDLRTSIVATMDKNMPAATKRVLMRKDVESFEKGCTRFDPDAAAVFHATLEQLAPSSTPTPELASASATGSIPAPAPAPAPAPPRPAQSAMVAPAAVSTGQPAEAPPSHPRGPLPNFDGATATMSHGWVVLIRGDKEHRGEINFDGYDLSSTSLPPAGAVLSARRLLAIWSEPRPDPSNMMARLNAGECVRVMSTRPGSGAPWAEVAPSACR